VNRERRQRAWLLALVVGMLALLLPLAGGRVLPFHDASGIIGLSGALALRDDPGARVGEFYDIDIRAYPSSLYFGWAYLAGALGVPMEIAFSVFTAVFILLGPLLAMLLLLSAHGRPGYLALLVLPVSYHHQVWFGFLGSSAAITGILLALAFARRLIDRPGIGNHLGLAFALLYVAAAHPFPLAFTLAAVAPLLFWPVGGGTAAGVPAGRRIFEQGLRLATLLPTVLFLLGWSGRFFAGRSSGVPLHRRVLAELRPGLPAWSDARQFLEWLGNGYKTGWDELVPALALLTVVVYLAIGARPARPLADPPGPPPGSRRWDRLVVAGLGWPAALFALGYLFLPMKLMWPDVWWGVRVRCVMPLYLLAVALVPVRPRGLPAWGTIPALAGALFSFGYITHDFATYWRGRCLVGFEQALAAIPPGRSVLVFPDLPDPHYTEGHPYLPQHYVARKGGRVVPYLGGHPGSYWITMKPPPPSPPWGDPDLFVWQEHASGYDYFLLERPARGPAPEPMRSAPSGAVEVVSDLGQWLLWKRREPAAAREP
jgi:hypothetical protein